MPDVQEERRLRIADDLSSVIEDLVSLGEDVDEFWPRGYAEASDLITEAVATVRRAREHFASGVQTGGNPQ